MTDLFPKAAIDYWTDAWQRTILTWDVLRERGNQYIEHEKSGKPPVLAFDYEIIMDGRQLERPANYALARIKPPAGSPPTDPAKRPFVVIDPRAGHGPGIGGFKMDSEVGIALQTAHPCYFVMFFPQPVPGQTIEAVRAAEIEFLRKVNALHPDAEGKPFVIGNCQGGWALMMLASLAPELVGPILLAASPVSYWAGVAGKNPMRYSGGLLGGSWMASLAGDLGHGNFDGAYLVNNFEGLNPANSLWAKLYNLYSKVDTERGRFLEFEKWWGGHFLMAAPPLLELEEPPALGIDLRVEVVELGPKAVRGIEALEIVDEVGAVEIAVAEVAGERRHPGAAEEPARVAHRVLARDARPVRDRRGGEEDRTDELGRERGEHHERPATLAVADHERLAFGVGMQRVHLAQEFDLGGAHGLDRLAGDRLREEHHEVAGMRGLERDADLAVHLEAADAGAVAGARIDDDEGPLRRIGGRRPGRRLDARERIVGGALQVTAVHDDLVVEGEHRRLAGLLVLDVLVAALAQDVPGEDRALPRVDPVVDRRIHGLMLDQTRLRTMSVGRSRVKAAKEAYTCAKPPSPNNSVPAM